MYFGSFSRVILKSFPRIALLLVVLFPSIPKSSVSGEKFQFFLDIKDMLDPTWVYRELKVVDSKIQCAALCHRSRGKCFYFGYKDNGCYLLKDNVDRQTCSLDDCGETGMKIYKLNVLESTTTKSPVSVVVDEIAKKEQELADDKTTTKAADSTTTTTEALTAKTTTTSAKEEPSETTSTSTEAAGTTSTTDSTTTSTTTSTTEETTTNEPTTTAEEDGSCEDNPEKKTAKADLFCAQTSYLISQMKSRMVFFSDVLGVACNDMKKQVYSDEETIHIFFSPDGGISISAKCPKENEVVVRFVLCVKAGRIPSLQLHCHALEDDDLIEDRYNATSDHDIASNLSVDCGDKASLQGMYFMESKDPGTRVVFQCLRLKVEDTLPEAPDTGL